MDLDDPKTYLKRYQELARAQKKPATQSYFGQSMVATVTIAKDMEIDSAASSSSAAAAMPSKALADAADLPRECTINRLTKSSNENWGADPEAMLAKIREANSVAFAQGLAAQTQAAYATGANTYETFCQLTSIAPYATNEDILMLFVGWYQPEVQIATIENYLSAVRQRHIERSLPWVERNEMPRLKRLLKGYEWQQKATIEGRVRMPVTMDTLALVLFIKRQREENEFKRTGRRPSHYSLKSYRLAAALYSTLLIGLHRPSECTERVTSKGPVSKPPKIRDTVLRTQGDGLGITGMSIAIPRHKCDPDGERGYVEYGLTGHVDVCASSRVAELIAARQTGCANSQDSAEDIQPDAPLFAIKDGPDGPIRAVKYEDLLAQLTEDLLAAGFEPKNFKGHSFRIGGATTLARNGVPTSVIEDMGGWARGSLTLPRYLRDVSSAELRRRMGVFFTREYVAPDDEPSTGLGTESLLRSGWQ